MGNMKRSIRTLIMLSLAISLKAESTPAGKLPDLHARVTYPVLQELMGGCSLRCAFFWKTLAGNPAKPASKLCDDDATTGWMAPKDWQNTPISFHLPKKLPPDCHDTPFYGLSIANGMIESLQSFRSHARVKTMTVALSGKPIARLHLVDTWKWQDFHFDDVPLNQGDVISLSIEEIYPGKDSQQPVLTEVVLQGGH